MEKLVDCPKCGGWGFSRKTDKLCLCCCEYNYGFTPGKLPESVVQRLFPNQISKTEKEKQKMETQKSLEVLLKEMDEHTSDLRNVVDRLEGIVITLAAPDTKKPNSEVRESPQGLINQLTDIMEIHHNQAHQIRGYVACIEKLVGEISEKNE